MPGGGAVSSLNSAEKQWVVVPAVSSRPRYCQRTGARPTSAGVSRRGTPARSPSLATSSFDPRKRNHNAGSAGPVGGSTPVMNAVVMAYG